MATQSQHFAIDDHSMETRIRLLEQLYEPLRVSRTTAPRVTRTDSTGWHHLMCLNRFDGISAAVVEPYFPIAPTHPYSMFADKSGATEVYHATLWRDCVDEQSYMYMLDQTNHF